MKRNFLLLTTLAAAACNPFRHETPQSQSEQIVRLEHEWNKAIRSRDSAALERLLAPDFVLGSDSRTHGAVSRKLWLSATLRPVAFDTLGSDNIAVTLQGDTAVAKLRTFWRARVSGVRMSAASRVSDVWVRRNERWQVRSRRVLRQETPPKLVSK